MTLMIPKLDFVQPNHMSYPTDFALGSAYDPYTLKILSPIQFDNSDATYYKYTVTGAYGGGFAGLTGDDKELLKVTLTSSADPYTNVSAGCYIVIDYDSVILKDDQSPYHEIDCAGTVDGWVLIDSADPLVVIDNIGDYDDPVPYIVQHDGGGLIIPEFDLTYTDDYDLYSAMYLIQDVSASAPDDPSDFALAVGPVDGVLTDIDDWPLPIGSLAEGTYTIYFLVTDEAGNFYILDWDFVIDNTPTGPIVWEPQRQVCSMLTHHTQRGPTD